MECERQDTTIPVSKNDSAIAKNLLALLIHESTIFIQIHTCQAEKLIFMC